MGICYGASHENAKQKNVLQQPLPFFPSLSVKKENEIHPPEKNRDTLAPPTPAYKFDENRNNQTNPNYSPSKFIRFKENLAPSIKNGVEKNLNFILEIKEKIPTVESIIMPCIPNENNLNPTDDEENYIVNEIMKDSQELKNPDNRSVNPSPFGRNKNRNNSTYDNRNDVMISMKVDSNKPKKENIQLSVETPNLLFKTHEFKNGDLYIGQYTLNTPYGEGNFLTKGYSYFGQWKNGKPDGTGQEIYENLNCRFKGEYIASIKNGPGIIRFYDGSYFEGELVNDNVQGFGVLVWNSKSNAGKEDQNCPCSSHKKNANAGILTQKSVNGLILLGCQNRQIGNSHSNSDKMRTNYFSHSTAQNKYEGYWKENMFHGLGKTTFSDGNIYEGEYRENKKNGFGVFYWPGPKMNWKIFAGFWLNGKKHGKGVIMFENGIQKYQIWKDGVKFRTEKGKEEENLSYFIEICKEKRIGLGELLERKGGTSLKCKKCV